MSTKDDADGDRYSSWDALEHEDGGPATEAAELELRVGSSLVRARAHGRDAARRVAALFRRGLSAALVLIGLTLGVILWIAVNWMVGLAVLGFGVAGGAVLAPRGSVDRPASGSGSPE